MLKVGVALRVPFIESFFLEISKVTLTIEKQPIFLFSHILCCFVFISFVYVLFFCLPFPFSMASVPRGSNKPVSNVHQHFDNLPDNRVKCKRCPWTHHKNATRQAEHLKTHKEVVPDVSNSDSAVAAEISSPDGDGSKKRKQPGMTEHVDRPLSIYEQTNCQLKQVFYAIMNGQQWQPWYVAFVASLRRSYALPSVRLMDSLHFSCTRTLSRLLTRPWFAKVFAHWLLMVGRH